MRIILLTLGPPVTGQLKCTQFFGKKIKKKSSVPCSDTWVDSEPPAVCSGCGTRCPIHSPFSQTRPPIWAVPRTWSRCPWARISWSCPASCGRPRRCRAVAVSRSTCNRARLRPSCRWAVSSPWTPGPGSRRRLSSPRRWNSRLRTRNPFRRRSARSCRPVRCPARAKCPPDRSAQTRRFASENSYTTVVR